MAGFRAPWKYTYTVRIIGGPFSRKYSMNTRPQERFSKLLKIERHQYRYPRRPVGNIRPYPQLSKIIGSIAGAGYICFLPSPTFSSSLRSYACSQGNNTRKHMRRLIFSNDPRIAGPLEQKRKKEKNKKTKQNKERPEIEPKDRLASVPNRIQPLGLYT